VTKTRRRVTWELRDRHGGKVDPKWANRRRLLTGRERLSDKNFAMMWNAIDEDASAQILSAYIAKEELRTLLSTVRLGGKNPHLTRHRLHRFLAWCIDSNISELIAPVKTVDLRWPEIKAAILTGALQRPLRGLQPARQTRRPQRLRLPQPHQPTPPDTLGLHPPTPASASHHHHHRTARSSAMSRLG